VYCGGVVVVYEEVYVGTCSGNESSNGLSTKSRMAGKYAKDKY